ncbi:MAG: hypothetical protein JWM06_1685 [Actinomycetia bacterium]|nr:hypothetical protein [Actinomycetes bacterium]
MTDRRDVVLRCGCLPMSYPDADDYMHVTDPSERWSESGYLAEAERRTYDEVIGQPSAEPADSAVAR